MKATFNRYRWLPFNMIAMTVVAGGIILFGLSKLENYLVDRTGRDLQWVSMEIAEKIDLLLAERLGDMQLISGLLSKVNSEKRVQEWNRHFEQLREAYPIYAWIGVLDKAGRVVAATDSKTIGKEVVGAQWEGSRNTNASVTIQEYQRDPLVDGYKTIGFAAAVTSSGVQGSIGSFEGTIVTRIKLSELDAMVTRSLREMREKMQSRQGMEYQVINRHGGVLIESLRQDNGNTNLIKLGVKSAKYATTGETGFVIEHHARRAVQVLTGYAPIPEREDFPPLGWGILVRVDHLDVLGPIREMVRTITWWGVATFIPMWILLIWTMRQLRAEWQQTVEAQQASEEAHNLIQSVLDNASDAHIILNEGGIVKGWNPKAEAVFGWSAEEAMGRLMADLCHAPTDRKQSAGKDLGAVLTIGVRRMLTERTTYDCWRKDGNLFPVDVSMTAVRGPHGFQYSIFARDITEQKQEDWYKNAEFQIAELLLINSSLEGASRAVIRTLCQMFEWKVGVLWLIDVNKESFGYVKGWHVADEGLEAFLDESQHIRFKPGEDLPGKVVASKKVEWVKDVGTEKSCARSTVAMRLGLHGACAVPIKIQGKVRGVIEFFSNAMREPDQQLLNFFSGLSTQFSHYFAREVMQQQLETSEARFSGMVQMADDAIISIDDAQRIVVFNRGAETIFDYTAEEVVGRSLDVLLPEELRASHRHSVNAFAGSGLTSKSMADRREIQGHRKNGEAFPAEASIAKVTVKGETTYTVILRDISKRKREEEALRASKHRAEELVNQKRTLLATVEAFFIQLTDGAVVAEWTKQAERAFGVTAEEAIGQPFRALAIAWDWEAVQEAIAQTMQRREAVHLNKVSVTHPGKRARFLKLALSPLPKDHGLDLVLMGEDITEYLALEHDLSQAQKLESLGQLAAGVAHEINTPTQFVGDNMRFLSDAFTDLQAVLERHAALLNAAKTGQPTTEAITQCEAEAQRADLEYLADEVPKAIAQSLDGVERIAKIVRAMKEFGHPGGEEAAYEDLNKAIETTVEVSRNEWKYVADMTTTFASDLPLVCCQLGPINQVVLNIIVNAAHAIGDLVKGTNQKGQITIATRAVDGGVEIQITDTGGGIPDAVREKIFDPFFTTKPVGKGTGQGLAIARSVVDKHGGTIAVDSQMGQGTTFRIRLPVKPSEAPPLEQAA